MVVCVWDVVWFCNGDCGWIFVYGGVKLDGYYWYEKLLFSWYCGFVVNGVDFVLVVCVVVVNVEYWSFIFFGGGLWSGVMGGKS